MRPLPFGNYIVYVDESGDHGLASIDPNYPVFVLAFCIFRKQAYWRHCVPAVQRFKFQHFGHDMIILHEREIRLAHSPFQFLRDPTQRPRFMAGLTELIESTEFTVIASAIHKKRLQDRYHLPDNPYDLALAFCLKQLQSFLIEKGENARLVHVVFECRGKREDAALDLEFRRVCDEANWTQQNLLLFEPVFAPKSTNSCGLQLADLIARPIGRSILNPDQNNRAYASIRKKFRRSQGGELRGYGLRVFP